jgi:hypothetical protein
MDHAAGEHDKLQLEGQLYATDDTTADKLAHSDQTGRDTDSTLRISTHHQNHFRH